MNLPLFAGFLAIFLAASTLSAKPADKNATKTGDDWIVIPEGFMASRLAVAPGTAKNWRRVVVDAPRSESAENVHPKVIRSCGEAAVDTMAVDYVKTALRYDKKLAANLATHTLGFQLELRPYVPILEPAQPRPADAKPDSFLTPKPGYPYYSRKNYEDGLGQFRITFGPAAGRPREVMRLRTTGSEVLDANFVIYALNHWYAPDPKSASTAERTMVMEVDYRLRL